MMCAKDAEIASTESKERSKGPATRSHRVLVVDDNRDGAEMLAMMLEFGGHETRAAHSGSEALATAATFHPQIVFLDIGLPGMSGYDVARELRADPNLAGAVLVALTGWGRVEDKQRTKHAGFDFHLTKPVDTAAIDAIMAGLSAASPAPVLAPVT